MRLLIHLLTKEHIYSTVRSLLASEHDHRRTPVVSCPCVSSTLGPLLCLGVLLLLLLICSFLLLYNVVIVVTSDSVLVVTIRVVAAAAAIAVAASPSDFLRNRAKLPGKRA